jgi:signal transduction histidine kinase
MLDLVLADDGRRGAPLVPGNGLTNCKRRAELVGGTLVTLSSDRGVTLRLGVPIGD